MLRSLSNAISQSTEDGEAVEMVILMQSVSGIPQEILESMKATVSENSVLINSRKFIDELNKLLSSYTIGNLIVGGVTSAAEWDADIPF